MDAFIVTCLFCGAEIGESEPLVVVEHDGERETSLAKEPELRDRVPVLVIHGRCAHHASALDTRRGAARVDRSHGG